MAVEWQGRQYQKYLLDIMSVYRQRQDLKAYLELLLSVGVIAMFILFAIKPTLVTIADLLTKINSEQLTSNEMDTKIANLSTAQTLFNQEENNIQYINQAVPDGANVASYIRQIEGVVKKDSVSAVNLTVGQTTLLPSTVATGSANTATVSVSMSGNYQNLGNAMQDLENLRRPALLNKIDFNAQTLTVSLQTPYN